VRAFTVAPPRTFHIKYSVTSSFHLTFTSPHVHLDPCHSPGFAPLHGSPCLLPWFRAFRSLAVDYLYPAHPSLLPLFTQPRHSTQHRQAEHTARCSSNSFRSSLSLWPRSLSETQAPTPPSLAVLRCPPSTTALALIAGMSTSSRSSAPSPTVTAGKVSLTRGARMEDLSRGLATTRTRS
jgi:hypothetical protein